MEAAWMRDGRNDTDRNIDGQSYDRFYKNFRSGDACRDNEKCNRNMVTRNCYFDEEPRYEPVRIIKKRVSFQTRKPNEKEERTQRTPVIRTFNYQTTTPRSYPTTSSKKQQRQITGDFIKMSGSRSINYNHSNNFTNNHSSNHSNNHSNNLNYINNLTNNYSNNLSNNHSNFRFVNNVEGKRPGKFYTHRQPPAISRCSTEPSYISSSHSREVQQSVNTATGRDRATVVSDLRGKAIRKLLGRVKEEAEVKRLNEMTFSPDKRTQHALVLCDLKAFNELVDELFSSGVFERRSERKLMEFEKEGEDRQTRKMMKEKEMQSLEWLGMQVFGEEFPRKTVYQTSFLNQQLSSF